MVVSKSRWSDFCFMGGGIFSNLYIHHMGFSEKSQELEIMKQKFKHFDKPATVSSHSLQSQQPSTIGMYTETTQAVKHSECSNSSTTMATSSEKHMEPSNELLMSSPKHMETSNELLMSSSMLHEEPVHNQCHPLITRLKKISSKPISDESSFCMLYGIDSSWLLRQFHDGRLSDLILAVSTNIALLSFSHAFHINTVKEITYQPLHLTLQFLQSSLCSVALDYFQRIRIAIKSAMSTYCDCDCAQGTFEDTGKHDSEGYDERMLSRVLFYIYAEDHNAHAHEGCDGAASSLVGSQSSNYLVAPLSQDESLTLKLAYVDFMCGRSLSLSLSLCHHRIDLDMISKSLSLSTKGPESTTVTTIATATAATTAATTTSTPTTMTTLATLEFRSVFQSIWHLYWYSECRQWFDDLSAHVSTFMRFHTTT